MWRLLRSGVEVLKHGRRGNPKFKTLLCDVNLTKLYWRSQGSKADPDQDDLSDDIRYHPTLLDSSAGSAELAHGISPLDVHNSSGRRKQFGTKSNADRVLYIRDIVAVSMCSWCMLCLVVHVVVVLYVVSVVVYVRCGTIVGAEVHNFVLLYVLFVLLVLYKHSYYYIILILHCINTIFLFCYCTLLSTILYSRCGMTVVPR